MHESYDRRTYKNDIALIKLKTKATFNDDIWPICLPPSNIVLEGQSAFVTGEFLYSCLEIEWCLTRFNKVGVQRRTVDRQAMFYWRWSCPFGNWLIVKVPTLSQSANSICVLDTKQVARILVRYKMSNCLCVFIHLHCLLIFIHLKGDSGGPLMYQMSTGRWAVVGVVSWGE